MAFWRPRKDPRPPLPTGEPVEFEPEPKPKPRRGLFGLRGGEAEVDSEFGPLKVGDKADPEARRRVVQQAEAVWRERYVRPFMAWFTAQVPSTDVIGPGGLRFAGDAVWNLARFYVELYAWHELGFQPPDAAALKEAVALDRRNFEILHRFFQERYPRVAQTWAIQPFADEASFWRAFRQSARLFEGGRDDGIAQNVAADEQAWVSGLTGMMSLAVSWTGFLGGARPPAPA